MLVAFEQPVWNFWLFDAGTFSSANVALKEAKKYFTLSTLSHSIPSEYSGLLMLSHSLDESYSSVQIYFLCTI